MNTLERAVTAAARHNIELIADGRTLILRRDNGDVMQQYGVAGEPVTDEVLEDLATYFDNAGDIDIMNIYSTDLFTYMAGDMIGQSTISLTIADVTMENMNSGKGGAQTKPCLRFKERSKLMVLNKTNAKTLAAILGPETENWKGARITIAAPIVDAFGKSTRSLRVIDVQPPELIAAKPRGAPNAPQPELIAADDAAQTGREYQE